MKYLIVAIALFLSSCNGFDGIGNIFPKQMVKVEQDGNTVVFVILSPLKDQNYNENPLGIYEVSLNGETVKEEHINKILNEVYMHEFKSGDTLESDKGENLFELSLDEIEEVRFGILYRFKCITPVQGDEEVKNDLIDCNK